MTVNSVGDGRLMMSISKEVKSVTRDWQTWERISLALKLALIASFND